MCAQEGYDHRSLLLYLATNLGLAQEWCDHRSVLIYLAMKYVLRGGMVALATHRPGYRIRAQEWYGSISYSLSWHLDMHSGRYSSIKPLLGTACHRHLSVTQYGDISYDTCPGV
jgi:hypothetical protein